jgi:Flp pilus assembly protein TadG
MFDLDKFGGGPSSPRLKARASGSKDWVKVRPRFARGRIEGQCGQALVEFVIVFPLLVILFLFIAVQTWYWWNARHEARICNA